jgi:hypothetical protein
MERAFFGFQDSDESPLTADPEPAMGNAGKYTPDATPCDFRK